MVLRGARSTTKVIITTQDKQVLPFHQKVFNLPDPSWCWEMAGNANIFLRFPTNSAQQWLMLLKLRRTNTMVPCIHVDRYGLAIVVPRSVLFVVWNHNAPLVTHRIGIRLSYVKDKPKSHGLRKKGNSSSVSKDYMPRSTATDAGLNDQQIWFIYRWFNWHCLVFCKFNVDTWAKPCVLISISLA